MKTLLLAIWSAGTGAHTLQENYCTFNVIQDANNKNPINTTAAA